MPVYKYHVPLPVQKTHVCALQAQSSRKLPNSHFLIVPLILQRCVQCNNNAPNCQTVGTDGPGVNNADYILYVGADPGGSCTTTGVLAFANLCQMESTLDR